MQLGKWVRSYVAHATFIKTRRSEIAGNVEWELVVYRVANKKVGAYLGERDTDTNYCAG